MTCNQAIVLLDVRRGFSRTRHSGTVDNDLSILKRAGFIEEDKWGNWALTETGGAVCDDTLADLSYALREGIGE